MKIKHNRDLYFQYMPIPKNINQSSRSRPYDKIKYIVIHDTGNRSKGANALAHKNYFSKKRNASAHYFVDDRRIIQIIGDSRIAWHCGDNQGKGRFLGGVGNYNSLGIELCINYDSDYITAYSNMIELVKNLMAKFNIPPKNVVRHYDVSRKICPRSMCGNNWKIWQEFKQEIQKPIYFKIKGL